MSTATSRISSSAISSARSSIQPSTADVSLLVVMQHIIVVHHAPSRSRERTGDHPGALRLATYEPEDGWNGTWAFGALLDDAGERARYALRYEPEAPIDPREAWLAIGIGDWSDPDSPAGRVAFGLRVFAAALR